MKNLTFERFEMMIDDAGPFSREKLIHAVDFADLTNFSNEQLKLAAEVLTHVTSLAYVN